MKKLTLLLALAASLSLAACEDKPERVVRETRVVNHYHTSENVSAPHNNSGDFEPVERPSTYSH